MIFSPNFQKQNPQISNFVNILLLGAGMFDEDRETDGLIDMKKLIVIIQCI